MELSSWVLLIMVYTNSGVISQAIDFNSHENCIQAEKDVQYLKQGLNEIKTFCILRN